MNPDGTGQHPLTADNDTRDYGPAWSPDGSRIAYWGRVGIGAGDIYVMNSSGTNQKPLTDAVDSDTSPAWSPDGQTIAFNSDRRYGYNEIFVMNSDDTGQTPLGSLDEGQDPSYSPDGRSIAFWRRYDPSNSSQILAVDADGTDLRYLSHFHTPGLRPSAGLSPRDRRPRARRPPLGGSRNPADRRAERRAVFRGEVPSG